MVVYKLLRPNGGLCILNEYSVNFVAGERNMDTVLPPVPLSFVLRSYFCFLSALNVIVDVFQSYFCFLSALNVTVDLPLLFLLTVHEG